MNRRYRLERGFLPFTSLFAILAAVAIGPSTVTMSKATFCSSCRPQVSTSRALQ